MSRITAATTVPWRRGPKRRCPAVAWILLVAAVACGRDGASPTGPSNQVPAAITVSPASPLLTSLLDTVRLVATARDETGSTLGSADATWSISDSLVATVDDQGLVTARANGQATVTARLHGVAGTAQLTVSQSAASVTVSPSAVALDTVGATHQFHADVRDANGSSLDAPELQWSSTDPSVVGIDSTGVATARSGGQSAIVAQSGSVADSAAITVAGGVQANGRPAVSITSPSGRSMHPYGYPIQFAGAGLDPEEGPLPDAALAWTSSIDGPIGGGASVTRSDLAAGAHVIWLIGTDSQGAVDTATVHIIVSTSNLPPVATILTPVTSSSFNVGTPIGFNGTGQDPEEGALDGVALEWSANLKGPIGTGASFIVSDLSIGTHTIRLAVTDADGAADTTTAAVTVTPVPVAAYDVELRYSAGTNPTAAQQQAFNNAVARWEDIVRGDVQSVSLNLSANACGSGSPPINETIDDLLIFVSVQSIDGPGGILGSAGPCVIRSSSGLPAVGRMRFDSADLASLEASGRLEAVILHEMGHVLGIGTLWNLNGLLIDPSSGGGADPHFVGLLALAAFDNVGGFAYTGGAKVPVENSGGGGTRDAHWRESVLDSELMTGWLESGANNPLSVLTVSSLADLGYSINTAAADAFALGSSLRLGPSAQLALPGDVLHLPIYRVDPGGRVDGILLPGD